MKGKNKGYTLVEMIVVLAIIAILSGLSFVTLGIINQARYNSAAETLSEQMGSLLVKTKALSKAEKDTTCMVIVKTTASPVSRNIGTYSLILGKDTARNGASVVLETDPAIEATLPKILDQVAYTPAPDASQQSALIGTTVTNVNSNITQGEIVGYLEFNKSNGSVRYGAGAYSLYYQGRVVATVHLDASTGNHYVK